ncbi:MAG: carboxypeptidase-like regulatory domain-containing protein [Sphingomonadaceae bacterium]
MSDRTSIALGMQSMYYAGKRRDYIEGNVLRSFGSMQLGLSSAYQLGGGIATKANALGRLGKVNLAFDAVWVQGDFSSEFVGSDIRYATTLRADTSLRFGRFNLPLQAGISRAETKSGAKVTDWLISTATIIARTQLRTELRGQLASSDLSPAQTRDTTLRVLASRRVLGLALRGAADFNLSGSEKGFTRARLTTGKMLDDVSEINGEVEYEASTRDTRFALGYTRTFKKFALRGNAEYNTRGTFGLNLALSFSFGPDPANGGIRFSESRLARNGQADVLVFRDEDGNGRRDPGEEAIKDVTIAAGMRVTEAATGENGRVMVDDLKPFVPVLVGLDETTLGDPYLTPAVKGIVVVPRPGIATKVEIPVTPSGEVEGLLLSPVGTEQPGVALELVDMRGAVVAETLTEFDGFFLFEKVPYGKYQLRVASDAARVLQVQGVLGATVTVSRDNDIARMGAIKLRTSPATTIAASAPAGPGGSSP